MQCSIADFNYKTVEFAPRVFRTLRESVFGVSAEEWIREWSLENNDLIAKEGLPFSLLFLFSFESGGAVIWRATKVEPLQFLGTCI